ncbi:hypothetical protein TSAR_000274, partial [Trichomalopsis sarcophagae]
TDRSGAIQGGGTANNNTLETTAIKINCNNNSLTIVSVYAAGHNKVSDLNASSAEWDDAATNSRCGYINGWLNTKSIVLRLRALPPAEPTVSRSNSFLDIYLADSRITFSNTVNNKISVIDYYSDHKALFMHIN